MVAAATTRLVKIARATADQLDPTGPIVTESLRLREDKVMDKAVSRGLALVLALRPRVPRVQQLLSETPGGTEGDEASETVLENELLRDLARDAFQALPLCSVRV